MRWKSHITTSSDGKYEAEITMHITEAEAAAIAVALLAQLEQLEQLEQEHQANLAQYAAIHSLAEWLERASGVPLEQLKQIRYWAMFERLDSKGWTELAPSCRCDRSFTHPH